MIKNNILESTLGFTYVDDDNVQGPSRNNQMFQEVERWSHEKIIAFKIEKNSNDKEKYRFVYKNHNDVLSYGNWNKIKSFGSNLFDYLLLTPSKIKLMNSFANDKEETIMNTFLNEWHDTNETITIYEDSMNNKGKNLFPYWKELSKTNNHYSRWVIPRIRLIIYKILRRLDLISQIDAQDKLLLITWKIEKLEIMVSGLIGSLIDLPKRDNGWSNAKPLANDFFMKKADNSFSLSVKELIMSVRDGLINVPVFQREYVWNLKKIIPLLNSMIKDYPIGSILLADTDTIKFNNKNQIIASIQSGRSDKEMIVLDGQQRVTTILLCFEFKKIIESSYRNANRSVQSIVQKAQIEDICLKEIDGEYKFLKRTKISKEEGPKNYLITNSDINKKMFELMGDFKVSTITTDKLKTNQLIDIFKNINIGSQKLSNIHLLHSFLYGQDDTIDLIETLKKIDESYIIKRFEVPEDKIVQILKLIYDNKTNKTRTINKPYNINISAIFEVTTKVENARMFMQGAMAAQKVIELSIEILNDRYGFKNYRFIPNIAFLFTTASILIKKIKNLEEIDTLDFKITDALISDIDRWFSIIIKKSINKIYSSGTASKVNMDITNIFNDYYPNVELKAELINEIKESKYGTNSAIYKIIMGQLALLEPVSLIDGETKVITKETKYNKANNDQHHFLPRKCKSFLKLRDDVGDSIRNIFLIESKENRAKIKNNSPKKYLMKDVDNVNIPSAIKEISRTHLLSEIMLRNFYNSNESDAEELLKVLIDDRENRMYNLLNKKWSL
ncbi:GmrSD restriction endonuclease domain-containing protein [Candidatus Mycoplasma mahonii]|uniref:GmrSD restriction endonuclease domain-containing protein n=1 Tax=Candidatus Mycoplasma mahonii TaxID=3004105 RepID=UPI0026F31A5F|nr:DUF262 domain-containing protein [Candidatus Mycoplasma mahonii]WKX02769.1 DUF262 domain-containing protein [Candidatus Mycoplasma mahonii]